MTHERIKKPRNEWMNQDGKEMYTEWMERIDDASRDCVVDFDNVRDDILKSHRYQDRGGYASGILTFVYHMKRTYDRAEVTLLEQGREPLSARVDELMHYTGMMDLYGDDEENVGAKTLRRHNRDGIDFAVRATTGLARITQEKIAVQQPTAPRHSDYDGLADVLRNPSFHAMLEEFSFTGFGVHGDSVGTMIVSSDAEKKLKTHYGIDSDVSLLSVELQDEGHAHVRLNEVLRRVLRDKLKLQNRHGIERRALSGALAETPVTTGCPVRTPTSTSKKSGIAILSESLADHMDVCTAPRDIHTSLGCTSLRALLPIVRANT